MPTFTGSPATSNAYCTLAEIKAAMPDTSWGSTYDAILTALAERASRMIDLYTKRDIGAFAVLADTTRYFDGNGTTEQWIDEIAQAPTAVYVAESGDLSNYTTWSSGDYILWPYNTPPYLRLDIDLLNGTKSVWYKYPKAVKITAKFGYSVTPPPDIVQATLIQSIRWFKRGQQAYADVGAITDLGQLRYVKALDPDVAEILSSYRKVTI